MKSKSKLPHVLFVLSGLPTIGFSILTARQWPTVVHFVELGSYKSASAILSVMLIPLLLWLIPLVVGWRAFKKSDFDLFCSMSMLATAFVFLLIVVCVYVGTHPVTVI